MTHITMLTLGFYIT